MDEEDAFQHMPAINTGNTTRLIGQQWLDFLPFKLGHVITCVAYGKLLGGA
jgi:hypothetical protein